MSRLSEVLRSAERTDPLGCGDNFSIDTKVIDYFLDNPFPNEFSKDDDYAKAMNIPLKEFVAEIFKLATIAANFLKGGRANARGVTLADITKEQHELGREVEYEHTYGKNDIATFIALRIMLDHESETKPAADSVYYYMNAEGTPEVRGEK